MKCFTEASYFCFKPFSRPIDIKCITELYLQMYFTVFFTVFYYIFSCSIRQPTADTDSRAQVIFILNFFHRRQLEDIDVVFSLWLLDQFTLELILISVILSTAVFVFKSDWMSYPFWKQAHLMLAALEDRDNPHFHTTIISCIFPLSWQAG